MGVCSKGSTTRTEFLPESIRSRVVFLTLKGCVLLVTLSKERRTGYGAPPEREKRARVPYKQPVTAALAFLSTKDFFLGLPLNYHSFAEVPNRAERKVIENQEV